jgi:hypothetical protein
VVGINEMVDTLHELLATALKANLSLISVSQNKGTKRLAASAPIIAAPTAIAGIYGTNLQFMSELGWRYSLRSEPSSEWQCCVLRCGRVSSDLDGCNRRTIFSMGNGCSGQSALG